MECGVCVALGDLRQEWTVGSGREGKCEIEVYSNNVKILFFHLILPAFLSWLCFMWFLKEAGMFADLFCAWTTTVFIIMLSSIINYSATGAYS